MVKLNGIKSNKLIFQTIINIWIMPYFMTNVILVTIKI